MTFLKLYLHRLYRFSILFITNVILHFVSQSRRHLNREIFKFSKQYYQDIENFESKYRFRLNFIF